MSETPALNDQTILMVEDDGAVRAMGETLLRDAGFAVHAAGDAAEALALVAAGLAFDLLFTDIVMPGARDGLALALEITRLRPGTPVLLTTGWAERARDHTEHLPDAELIAKPYRQTELVRKIRALLNDRADGL